MARISMVLGALALLGILQNARSESGCQWCQSLAQTLNSQGNDGESMKMEIFCSADHHGGQIGREYCMEQVLSLTPKLSRLLGMGHNESSACQELDICTGKSNQIASKEGLSEVEPLSNATCILCEFIISQLQQILSQNSSEEEVKKALDDVCGYMPTTIRAECTAFVDKWAPAIIQLVMAKLDPQLVCREIKVCPHQLTHHVDHHAQPEVIEN